MGFSREDDARGVLAVLPKRFGKYGLTLHPDKTRLVPSQGPPGRPPTDPGKGPGAGAFDLLGSTHYWARSQKGNCVVKRNTAGSRLTRALGRVAEWCRVSR